VPLVTRRIIRLLDMKPKIGDSKFVCPCIVSIILNDDQKDATILVYLFVSNQLYKDQLHRSCEK